jgi:hypothetical protein
MNISKLINELGKDYDRLVFVSHKYADSPLENLKSAENICTYLHRQGYIPICPLLLFKYMPDDKEREILMTLCHILILVSPNFFIFHKSPGCKQELRWAIKHRKHIEDFSEYKNKDRLSNRELKNLMEKVRDIIV